MDELKKLFSNNPKYSKLSKALNAANVCDTARSLADSRFSVVSFKQGLLTLGVGSSAEASILKYEKATIMDAVNKKLGQNEVKDIRFKIVG